MLRLAVDELALRSVAAVSQVRREMVRKISGNSRRFVAWRRLLLPWAILGPEFPGSVRKMSDDRQYAPATLRNRDFILDVLRDVLPMTGVILEIASAQASISSISRETSRLSFSNLPFGVAGLSLRSVHTQGVSNSPEQPSVRPGLRDRNGHGLRNGDTGV
jgi:hypothetical protein